MSGTALVAWPLLPRWPTELIVAGVLLSTGLAVGRQGHLELSLFLVVMATLYASWHLGSSVRAALVAPAPTAAYWTDALLGQAATTRIRAPAIGTGVHDGTS